MTTSALMVAPNAGVSLSYGGGCKVTVKMAEALLESNVEVEITALHGLQLKELDRIHNTNLERFTGRIGTHYFLGSGFTSTNPLGSFFDFLPTYAGVFPLVITRHIKRVLSAFNPSIVIFHDDVLMNVKDLLGEHQSILYASFPMAARLKFKDPEEREEEQFRSKVSTFFLKPFLKRTIVIANPPCDVLFANSTITKNYMKTMWNRDDVTVIYPPVDSQLYKPSSPKEDLVVSVGPIQANKRLGDVIKALGEVKADFKCVIIGYVRDHHYYNHLLNYIAKARLTKRITVKPNASRDYIIKTLSRAKILVNAAKFEPFGISTVEGMASGCVPIVYKGPRSGPWLDIVEKGKYGTAFETNQELAERIDELLSDKKLHNHYAKKAVNRSKIFDSQIFKTRFIELVKQKGLI